MGNAFGSWVLVFKEGPFWFWNLNLSNDPRDPCQNLEANSSIFRTDPLCQWHSNEKQKKFQKFSNFWKSNIKFKGGWLTIKSGWMQSTSVTS
jgi:hypothetical protein